MPQSQLEQLLSLLQFTYGVSLHHVLLYIIKLTPTDMADPTRLRLRTSLRLGGVLGFIGGFLMAYQRSSCACFIHFHL